MKVYYAIYLDRNPINYLENEKRKSKEYSSLAICKRFTKKLNPIRYIEKEI